MFAIPHLPPISNDLSSGGYTYRCFLELHILTFNWSPQTFCVQFSKYCIKQIIKFLYY